MFIFHVCRFSTGVKWIKQKYGDDLRIIRIGQKGYLETIEMALIQGLFQIQLIFLLNVQFYFVLLLRVNQSKKNRENFMFRQNGADRKY